MKDANERLKEARERAGYREASDAARAIGVPLPTYLGHENGSRGLVRAAQRYAAFFRVSLDWLMTGRGEMKARQRPIPIVGRVGAGASVVPNDVDTAGLQGIGEIEMPDQDYLAALEVHGDSQYPRYLDGEIVLFDTRAKSAGQLLNRYAVVDLEDGRRLLKIIRKMPQAGRYRLESHNAAPEDDALIVAAYSVRGTLEP